MEKMLPGEIAAAARKVLNHLEPRRETPLLALRAVWSEDERSFYMGLGDLILQGQVMLQEREGVIWVVRGSAPAPGPPCRPGSTPGDELPICGACPSLLDACPSAGSARLMLAA